MNVISNSFGVSNKWGFISPTLVAFKEAQQWVWFQFGTYVFAFRIPQKQTCADRLYFVFSIPNFLFWCSFELAECQTFFFRYSIFRSKLFSLSLHCIGTHRIEKTFSELQWDFSMHLCERGKRKDFFCRREPRACLVCFSDVCSAWYPM